MKQEYDFSHAERGKFRADGPLSLPASRNDAAWGGPNGPLGRFVAEETARTLNAYREQPHLVTEHANQEHDTAHGGYAHRQLYELVQNSADALSHPGTGQSILIRLTEQFLYCADDGKPIDEDGVKGLMFAHMSSKRGTSEIGRFGMGFKSVLGVTDRPEFFSRSGSIRFDRNRAAERIGRVVPGAYPALRLPESIDPNDEAAKDDDLREFMGWATNIVRLPLRHHAFQDLAKQIDEFPPEFLLFVPHVRYLTLECMTLECSTGASREFTLRHEGEELELDTGESSSRWRCWERTHTLSTAARQDSRTLDDAGDVRIAWAAPLGALSESGRFWAFFPTQTASLLAGILNAPWKTNEDRQNLLAGPYNDELIDAAARMVADELPSLMTPEDPAKHLDALPRREDGGDGTHSIRLRQSLFSALYGRAIVPDQDGSLRVAAEVNYAPEELTSPRVVQEPLDRWQSCDHRPKDWAHHAVLTRNRLAKLNHLFEEEHAPRASLSEWLLALRDEWPEGALIQAAKAAIRVAALLPPPARKEPEHLGGIVVTQRGHWRSPNRTTLFLPRLPLSAGDNGMSDSLVHVDLASDERVTTDLRQLGLQEISSESAFRAAVSELVDEDAPMGELRLDRSFHIESLPDAWWQQFWQRSRTVDVDRATSMLKGVENRLRVQTMSGDWQATHSVLLPGAIVPDDRSRDGNVAVDIDFHSDDIDLLRGLGVADQPSERDLSSEPWFDAFLLICRKNYKSRDLPKNPQERLLEFTSTRGTGPLQVLTLLSDDGNSRYVDALLGVEASYRAWHMRHRTKDYPEARYGSPTLWMIAKHGRIRCAEGFVNVGDAVGQPRDTRAQQALLAHPLAERIRAAFGLAESRLEIVGEEDPVPVADVWPGAPQEWRRYSLVRCQRIFGEDGSEPSCVQRDSNVLLVSTGSDAQDIRLVAQKLGAELDGDDLDEILRFVAHSEVEQRRAGVREQSTDAAKLLCAVGEDALKQRLPSSLVHALEAAGDTLTGIDVAEAAIATFHTGALFEYRWELKGLAPPSRWAGSPRAVEFVQSLGFTPEWAGERRVRRPPFVEVEGPFSLPALHGYQQRIVRKVTELLRLAPTNGDARRGMISLPTGAGKTRVTVQAIVQAIRDGLYAGGVLWVADRDELCEQAVEAWRQVWSSKGAAAIPLRISRMWDQQPPPVATSELHIVVATIQTLHAKLSKGHPAYGFISNFGLVVFDEAHRSVAPSYTSVMEEIGFTRWRRYDEPFLLGLTATPYRGHDERETARLVNRYGRNRLDSGAFSSEDPISAVGELQKMGVLAQADHETISGGDFSLTKDEVAQVEAMPRPAWLPRSIEQRIASDTKRTLGIVAAYESHVAKRNPDWPTLIFATSVEHAQTVAALLNTTGVTARAVSGSTDRAVRRRVVDDFRSGQVNVLVNYGVFREGFDAPKTRAILVARPVYSPNLYFQMIGRGLRGPKNGGSERCLVINVQDNIDNFDRQLAFADLDWLWA